MEQRERTAAGRPVTLHQVPLLSNAKPHSTAKIRARRKLQGPASGFHGSPLRHTRWNDRQMRRMWEKWGKARLKTNQQASTAAHTCHLSTWRLLTTVPVTYHLQLVSCEVQNGKKYDQIPFCVTTLHFLSCDRHLRTFPERKHHEKNHSQHLKWCLTLAILFCFVLFICLLFATVPACIPTCLELTLWTRMPWNSQSQLLLPPECLDER